MLGLQKKSRPTMESATPCHDAQVVGLYQVTHNVLTVLAAKSEDYTTAPQHLQIELDHLCRNMEQVM